MTQAPDVLGALWLQTLQRAIGRASHDVKDALNGISVNLEVIRSRAARPDTPASAVMQFGDAATQQYERLATLIDAVLSLARAERDPADVAVTLRRIATLCSASAMSADAVVHVVEDEQVRSTLTSVRGDALRLALTAPLLEIVTGSDRTRRATEVQCTVSGDEAMIHVIIAAAGRNVGMPVGVGDVAHAAGVRWAQDAQKLTLAFPRA